MKVEEAAKELVQKAGLNWSSLDERDKNIYRDIARGVLLLSSDVSEIEEG